jgi:hypothetical protein
MKSDACSFSSLICLSLELFQINIIINSEVLFRLKFQMAYNPITRGGGGGLGGPGGPGGNANNINLGGAGGANNDQYTLQNMQPEDYLGKKQRRSLS